MTCRLLPALSPSHNEPYLWCTLQISHFLAEHNTAVSRRLAANPDERVERVEHKLALVRPGRSASCLSQHTWRASIAEWPTLQLRRCWPAFCTRPRRSPQLLSMFPLLRTASGFRLPSRPRPRNSSLRFCVLRLRGLRSLLTPSWPTSLRRRLQAMLAVPQGRHCHRGPCGCVGEWVSE